MMRSDAASHGEHGLVAKHWSKLVDAGRDGYYPSLGAGSQPALIRPDLQEFSKFRFFF